jgi:hypothetical protein
MGAKLPRLFISHSSTDNAQALAFQNWLVAAGWTREDVFIDLHGIGAGERWRDTLRKASKQCEAVIMLASPASLESVECQREMSFAEDQGKTGAPCHLPARCRCGTASSSTECLKPLFVCGACFATKPNVSSACIQNDERIDKARNIRLRLRT